MWVYIWTLRQDSLLFTSRDFCAFRSVGKTKTILVVDHREGCLKKWRTHCHGYKEAMREWVRSEMAKHF